MSRKYSTSNRKRYYHRGKRVSKGEKRIACYLDGKQVTYEMERTFEGCINDGGYLLRYDFYLKDFNMLIEFNGHHHYNPVNKYPRAKRVHEKTLVHDEIKTKFAKEHNIKLIKIHHKYYDIVEEILDRILFPTEILLEDQETDIK